MRFVIAVIIFSVVILIHELGHFLLAKKNHIEVVEFSLGMGPRIISTVKGGTRYSVKLLPLGGSCAMAGEDAEDDSPGTFNSAPVWIVQSVLDRKSHIRSSKLCHDRTILKLHHGMDDTLRLHHHLNMIQIHVKQPFGFHNFQPFVYQGCGIYGDLSSHYPVWMLQSICNSDPSQLFCGTSAEKKTKRSTSF